MGPFKNSAHATELAANSFAALKPARRCSSGKCRSGGHETDQIVRIEMDHFFFRPQARRSRRTSAFHFAAAFAEMPFFRNHSKASNGVSFSSNGLSVGLINRASNHLRLRYAPGRGQFLHAIDRFRFQGVGYFAGCYGHTFIMAIRLAESRDSLQFPERGEVGVAAGDRFHG